MALWVRSAGARLSRLVAARDRLKSRERRSDDSRSPRTVRLRRVPSLASHRLDPDPATHARLESVLGTVYSTVASVTGSRVLVDSSKCPMYGLLLRGVPGVRLHVVHLVRDSRAVAWSGQRKRRRPEIVDGDAYQATYTSLQSSYEWTVRNALAEMLGRGAADYARLTYEAFVSRPEATVRDIRRRIDAGIATTASSPMNDRPNHTVGGNPMRFSTSGMTIRPDLEWHEAFRGADRSLVTALTSPLLRRYGYL